MACTQLTFPIFERFDRLIHAITTTRFDGDDPFNLADHVGPAADRAIERRRLLCRKLGLDFSKLTVAEQVHRGRVACVDAANVGRGAEGRSDTIAGCDGLVTAEVYTPLLTLSADCPLVLIYDPRRHAIANVHASWRALADRILTNAVGLMSERFGCQSADLVAAVGPSAGPCCYQVGDDLVQQLPDDLRPFASSEPRRFDLWNACRRQLTGAGLSDANIQTIDLCTICDERFFSYRRQGSDTGRFALLAALGR